jgi:hypothetical protein
MLGVGYVNVPNKILERETHDNCLSVLFVVSTPEMNTTAENRDDWMKLWRCDMNSSLRLWGGGYQATVGFVKCRITLSTGDLC